MLGVLNATETAVYQSAVVGSGQDVLGETTAAVVQQCRGYIADHPANRLAVGTTLPERAILPALHLIRMELLGRLDLDASDDRRTAKRDAIRFFERVSDGRVAIEQPDGETDDSSGAAQVETLVSQNRRATRDKLAGL